MDTDGRRFCICAGQIEEAAAGSPKLIPGLAGTIQLTTDGHG
jgi:hypothetical protein